MAAGSKGHLADIDWDYWIHQMAAVDDLGWKKSKCPKAIVP